MVKAQQQQQAAPATVYSGSILPFSRDSAGNTHFDLTAGLPGQIWSALTLPGDVYTGGTPIMANDQPNPSLLGRATNFAAMMSPMNPAMRAGDLPIPGQAMAPMTPQKTAAPTAQALKDAASAGYDAFRNSDLQYHASAVADVARNIQNQLEQDGIIAEHAPKTFSVINKVISDGSAPGAVATTANMQAVRRSFGNVSGDPTDTLAATRAKNALDGFLQAPPPEAIVAGTATPESAAATADTLRTANANYAAAQRSNALTGSLDRANTGILEQAEARAEASHSGRNLDNSIRQRVASLLQQPGAVSGFSNDELDALRGVISGGPVQNTSRVVGNFLGGGGGLGHLAATGAAALAGGHMGGGEGAALGAMVPGVLGVGAKALENSLAKRSLNSVDELVRQRSPLYQQTLGQQPLYNPMAARNAAVLRAILPGLMAPQTPAQPPNFGSLGPGII